MPRPLRTRSRASPNSSSGNGADSSGRTSTAPDAAKVNGTAEGLLVSGIDPGGPAAAAGLAVGDVITSVNGQPAVSTEQLVELTLTKSPGDKVELAYTRAGASRTATLTLAPQP